MFRLSYAKQFLMLMMALAFVGCNEFLAERMVAPPNEHFRSTASTTAQITQPTSQGREIHIQTGPPDATLAAWVQEPKSSAAPHGTILVLHGFLNDHSQLEGAAGALREAGYRTILVDLRGHGQSTGDHITYGVLDAHDLSQLTDYLQQQNLCGPTIGVYGTSYGGASAILFAGADPRVTAVVAVAPYASLREETPHFGKYLLPIPGRFLTDSDYTAILARAGQIANFDPNACSPLAAIQKTAAHVRLFHGNMDVITPSEASKELAAAAPDRTELTILPGQGHLGLCFDPLGQLQTPARDWFDRYLSNGRRAATLSTQANTIR